MKHIPQSLETLQITANVRNQLPCLIVDVNLIRLRTRESSTEEMRLKGKQNEIVYSHYSSCKRAFVICIQQLRSNRRLAHDSASQLIKTVYSVSD